MPNRQSVLLALPRTWVPNSILSTRWLNHSTNSYSFSWIEMKKRYPIIGTMSSTIRPPPPSTVPPTDPCAGAVAAVRGGLENRRPRRPRTVARGPRPSGRRTTRHRPSWRRRCGRSACGSRRRATRKGRPSHCGRGRRADRAGRPVQLPAGSRRARGNPYSRPVLLSLGNVPARPPAPAPRAGRQLANFLAAISNVSL